jgi:hypothetical protein
MTRVWTFCTPAATVLAVHITAEIKLRLVDLKQDLDQPFHHTLIAGTTCSNLFFLLHLEAEVGKPWWFCMALSYFVVMCAANFATLQRTAYRCSDFSD